jgi:hypothetical protein
MMIRTMRSALRGRCNLDWQVYAAFPGMLQKLAAIYVVLSLIGSLMVFMPASAPAGKAIKEKVPLSEEARHTVMACFVEKVLVVG